MNKTFLYYDDQDVLCYYVGTYSGFISFLEDNPDYTKCK